MGVKETAPVSATRRSCWPQRPRLQLGHVLREGLEMTLRLWGAKEEDSRSAGVRVVSLGACGGGGAMLGWIRGGTRIGKTPKVHDARRMSSDQHKSIVWTVARSVKGWQRWPVSLWSNHQYWHGHPGPQAGTSDVPPSMVGFPRTESREGGVGGGYGLSIIRHPISPSPDHKAPARWLHLRPLSLLRP